jgi:hypothetical protein
MSNWKEDSQSWKRGSAPSPSDPAVSGEPIASTFETITRRFDPGSSYVIFEKPSGASDARSFQQVMELLAGLNLPVRSKEFAMDDQRGKLLLIVRFDSGRADEILHELMKEGIPRDVLLYAYGSHTEV